MIDSHLYDEILKKWYYIGEVYQEPRRVLYRLEHFETYALPFLKDKKVVEIGCNAGMFGYHIAQVAKSYVGVEPGNRIRDKSKKKPPKTDYFRQAQITQEYIENKHAGFVNETITEFCGKDQQVDAFVACYALYHFRDNELELLKEKIFPQCEVVIIQNRNQKRPTEHNSYKFWKDKNVVAFFETLGFTCEVFSAKSKKGKIFSEIICRKDIHENRRTSVSDTKSANPPAEGPDTRSGEAGMDKGSTQPDVPATAPDSGSSGDRKDSSKGS